MNFLSRGCVIRRTRRNFSVSNTQRPRNVATVNLICVKMFILDSDKIMNRFKGFSLTQSISLRDKKASGKQTTKTVINFPSFSLLSVFNRDILVSMISAKGLCDN